METVFLNLGDYTLTYCIQLLIGIVLSFPLYRLLKKARTFLWAHNILSALVFCLLGVLLPLGPFGVLPLAIGASMALQASTYVLPILASNATFNMLIPLNETGFRFSASMIRILSALVIGFLCYLVLRLMDKDPLRLLRKNKQDLFTSSYEKGLGNLFTVYVNEIGLFLILAVLLNSIRAYLVSDTMTVFLNTGIGNSFKNLLLERNASNSLFFISMSSLFNTLIDFSAPAAFLSFFRARTVLTFYIVAGVVCVVLLIPIFIG